MKLLEVQQGIYQSCTEVEVEVIVLGTEEAVIKVTTVVEAEVIKLEVQERRI
jgi:hypothetical protein